MDALSDLLQSVKLTSALFLESRLTAPWCVESRSGCGPDAGLPRGCHVIFFHLITAGCCRTRLSRGGEVIEAAQGDLLLLAHADAHLLGSDLQLAPVHADALVRPAQGGGLYRIEHGGGGEETRVMCGYLACDPQLSRPLLDALPRLLRIPLGASAPWLLELARRGASENNAPGPGSSTLLARLAELLVIEAVRRHIDALPAGEQGWLSGLRDRHVSRALALLHAQPAQEWTVDGLAAQTGLSRSALAQRFNTLIGQPPMAYLKRWRLSLAAAALGRDGRKVAALAERYGYESEAAFSRAFKREFGLPPAAWRRARGAG